MEYPKLLASSQDPTVLKLRIKAILPLVVPVINAMVPGLLPDDLDTVVDSAFILIAAGMHIYGWIRAKRGV